MMMHAAGGQPDERCCLAIDMDQNTLPTDGAMRCRMAMHDWGVWIVCVNMVCEYCVFAFVSCVRVRA